MIETVHMDTKGSLHEESVHGHVCFPSNIRKYIRFITVPLVKSKSDAAGVVLRSMKYFKMQSDHLIQKVHTDEGTDLSRALASFVNDGVCLSLHLPTYTPEFSELAEKIHQTTGNLLSTCLLGTDL